MRLFIDFMPENTDNKENIDNKKLLNSKKYFDQALFTHKEYNSPQSVQGMWQAYGQMNAARISGRYTLAATGMAIALKISENKLIL